MARLEDVDVVSVFHEKVVDVDCSLLSVSSGTTDGLSHAGFPIVLSGSEEWREEDNVVRALEISIDQQVSRFLGQR